MDKKKLRNTSKPFSVISHSPMDNLPDPLIIEILSRLNDSTELTRCKCVSKTLNRLAQQVRSIHLYWSLDRYTKMRSPEEARSKITPFKTIFHKLISDAEVLIKSVSLGVDTSIYQSLHYDYKFEDKCDDLFLTSCPFSAGWMTKIGQGLKSILISDFSAQSAFKETKILEVLSCNCHSLVELTLKNAELCVEDMHPMPLLTRLTLKDVQILDSHLTKLMECLPCLQVLILFQKFGNFNENYSKIHHLNLKELKCMWEDFRSITIFAPKLTKLEFLGVVLAKISIHAPLLSYFHLTLASANEFNLENFNTLKTLHLVSWRLENVLSIFPSSTTVEDLTLESADGSVPLRLDEMINFNDVFTVFPKVTSLTLGSEVWSQLMLYPLELSSPVAEGWRSLKQVTVYLVLDDIDKALTFILYVKKICSKPMNIVLFIHFDVDLSVASSFVSLCTSLCLKVRCRWGTWEKAEELIYLTNMII